MKKKNVLMMALSLTLVAVVAIGGTLAYLTAAPDQVTNTFEFVTGFGDGEGVINVQVIETKPENGLGEASVSEKDDGGLAYTDVIPGQTLPKAPVIKTKAKVESWVFVRVTQGNVEIQEMNANWEPITDETLAEGTTVYAYKDTVPASNDYVAVDENPLFTEVKVQNVDGELDEIKIEVAAIQASEDFEDAQAAYDAGMLENMFQPVAG